MGTRADFYIGRGPDAKWLGSIAYDGYPDGISVDNNPESSHMLGAETEEEFREELSKFFKIRDDLTLPEQGWPWPWENSSTTDYAYAFDDGHVFISYFGRGWISAPTYICLFNRLGKINKELESDEENEELIKEKKEIENLFYEGEKNAVFPDMTAIQNVTLGKRSGVLILKSSAKKEN